ncbi:hypothetical protein [Rhizobium leguminosarum]|nr:hypothetical protein [Rhizobium leguminosarum]
MSIHEKRTVLERLVMGGTVRSLLPAPPAEHVWQAAWQQIAVQLANSIN